MEQALYLKDSYIREFDAVVKEVSNKTYIVLDQTAFYPTSGGQPNDTGILMKDGKKFNVLFCGKFSGQISHQVDREGLIPGDKVHGIIDWDRRYTLMRYHTAAHLLSQVIYQKTKALITGNQLDIDQARIDFAIDDYDPAKIREYIDEANRVMHDDLIITAETLPREQALMIPGVSRLAKGLPESLTNIRILSIGKFDIQADGGTHVHTTKEIGKIEVIKCENKGKNNRRLYFKLIP